MPNAEGIYETRNARRKRVHIHAKKNHIAFRDVKHDLKWEIMA